jgi:hypothetical protein
MDEPLEVTEQLKLRLAEALRGYYPAEQGRGHYCHVEHYRRGNGSEYFFVYLDDYPDARLVFDATGQMRKQRECGAFDVIIVYCPVDGTLETFVHGGKPVREAIEDMFADAVLDAALDPELPGSAAYALDGLKDANFAFAIEPEDGVIGVRLRRLRVEVPGSPGRRITLEAGPKDAPNAIHDMLQRYLNAEALPLAALRVIGVTITLDLANADGGRARTLTFDISHPSSCNLKSKTDEQRALGERCLKRWGISHG